MVAETASHTARFADVLHEASARGLHDDVAAEARRGLLNALAAAVESAAEPSVATLAACHGRYEPGGRAVVPGTGLRTNPVSAALLIGAAANIGSFDDTHWQTVIHPGGPAAGALIGALGDGHVDGDRALRAFALGIEAQLRVGLALGEAHYRRGWHVTGTCGVVGAAVAAAVVGGASRAQLRAAIDIGARWYVGSREAFGSMAKGLHPGKAAANGVLAATLALGLDTDAAGHVAAGCDGVDALLRGVSEGTDPSALCDGAGDRWHLLDNTYRPYPCGIVIHPVIDAALAAHGTVDPGHVVHVLVDCHPLVRELTGRPRPRDPLEARLSVEHSIAVALVDGAVGPAQYGQDYVDDPRVSALREVVELRPSEDVGKDQARLHVTAGGSADTATFVVDAARGSTSRPLTDDELRAKARMLIDPVLGAGAGDRVADAVADLPGAIDCTRLLAALTGSTTTGTP